jgi:hypothetical protein
MSSDAINENVSREVLGWAANSDLLAHSSYTIALTGSRTYGFSTDSSDFDFEILCDSQTFESICRRYRKRFDSKGITIPKKHHRLKLDREADVTVHSRQYVRNAIEQWKDEALWIWQHAIPVIDKAGWLESLESKMGRYPEKVLHEKIKKHFLVDFHLSVHGLTYNSDSENLFSVVFALSAKVAEYCRICCLLDNSPFPYEKWLLHACRNTTLGKYVAPLLEQVIGVITQIPKPMEENWSQIQNAVKLIDTQACDLLEERMVEFGISREWIDNAYDLIEEPVYG